MGMITAHSGCDKTKDNSMEFIRYALSSGSDCLEVDVRLDRNGALSLSHDETEEESVKLLEAFTLLKEKPDKKINCDLKQKGLEAPVYRMAETYQVEKQLIYSGEVSLDLMSGEKSSMPRAEIYLNIESLYPGIYEEADPWVRFEKLEAALRRAKEYPVSCVNMEYRLLTPQVLSLLSRLELKCSAWTVNGEGAIKRLLGHGDVVANVTTRNLKTALKIREEQRS